MRYLKLLVTALLMQICSGVAQAAPIEKIVVFKVDGQTVVGTLELPEGRKRPPVVLLLHGFKGSRDELQIPSLNEGIFKRAADAWAARGLASLRIDFRGGGDSEGAFEDTTISGQAKDALAALEFLQTEESIDPSRISLVGWSQGGAVASLVAGQTPYPLTAVALWNPLSMPASTMMANFGGDTVNAGLASQGDAVPVTMPWGLKTALKPAYFQDLFSIDPVAELARYSGPVFVAVGTKDDIIYPQPQSGQMLLAYHNGPGELWVRPMDHIFNVFQETATVDELIDATGTFLIQHTQ